MEKYTITDPENKEHEKATVGLHWTSLIFMTLSFVWMIEAIAENCQWAFLFHYGIVGTQFCFLLYNYHDYRQVFITRLIREHFKSGGIT